MTEINKKLAMDSVKNGGICDTCVTGYTQAIIENRLISKKLSEQTFEMQQLSEKLSHEIDSLKIALIRVKQKRDTVIQLAKR